jgi:pyruvate dehydrogenase E1 component beta subunit
VAEEAFHYLDAPVKRLGAPNTPVPFSPPLEQYYLPNEPKIVKAVKQVMSYDLQ